MLSVHLGQRKIIQDERSEEKRDEPEAETRFANIPRLYAFGDELRYVNVRSISTDSHTDTGRDQIDGHSNCRVAATETAALIPPTLTSTLTPFPSLIRRTLPQLRRPLFFYYRHQHTHLRPQTLATFLGAR